MKKTKLPLTARKSRQTNQKSSGKTSIKPRDITRFSRKDREIPADRGAYEKESSVQGSD